MFFRIKRSLLGLANTRRHQFALRQTVARQRQFDSSYKQDFHEQSSRVLAVFALTV